MLYSIGNIESAIADRLPEQLKNILVVAFHMSPMVVGLIFAIKTLWDSITDPVMAYITDNARTRWGRRIPFIFFGSVTRVIFLALFFWFLPVGSFLSSNALMEAQKGVNDGAKTLLEARAELVRVLDELEENPPEKEREILLGIVREYTEPDGEKSIEDARESIEEDLPVLKEDLAERRALVEERKEELSETYAELGLSVEAGDTIREIGRDLDRAQAALEEKDSAENRALVRELKEERAEIRRVHDLDEKKSETLRIAQGRVQSAEKHAKVAADLVKKGERALEEFVAVSSVAGYTMRAHAGVGGDGPVDRMQAQAAADTALAEMGVDSFDIFEVEPAPLPVKGKAKGMFAQITDGISALTDPVNAGQRELFVYVLIGILIFTLLTTIQSVPSYALGIELCPSYDGRTQVVVYRSVFSKLAGLLGPWLPVLVFTTIFMNAKEGLVYLSVAAVVIGIPTTVLMCWFVRERTETSVIKKQPNLFRSMAQIARIPEFLRITALFIIGGLGMGLVAPVGFYLNVYWVMGSALSGATLSAWLGTMSWGLGILMLPVIKWACHKYEKHRVLAAAFCLMGAGNLLAWWAITPEHPYRQAILPFFFSVGVGSVFTVLPTMMADATDLDEYRNFTRREGMFGAVMGFIMKLIGTLVPLLAGVLVTISGFDPSLEYRQTAETIFNMRLMIVFVPFGLVLVSLLLLVKYPLNRTRVEAIKATLKERHERAKEEQAG
ncbi:MAG: MFS transporter [Opitutales bacterium]